MEKIKLVKIDNREDAEIPNNNIKVNEEIEGYLTQEPKIGERFLIIKADSLFSGKSTSPVKEIINENTFKTCNSIYKIIRENEKT